MTGYRSRTTTHGRNMAGARALWRATGMNDADFGKPIIAIANSFTQFVPGHVHLHPVGQRVKQVIDASGGYGVEFNTIAVSDGVAMGTEGMKASLVSREVVADSIELVSRGHLFDGLVILSGCDKTNPGAAMAMARLDLPSVVLYNGTIYPGTYKGEPQDLVNVYEAIGAYNAGKISAQELYEIESAACPGAGACGGQFTANTMSMCLEFMGLSPAGLNGIPAEDPDKDEAARRCGELVMDLVRRDVRPRSYVTRESIENAVAGVAATGGSTNAVLHLSAIANEMGVSLPLTFFDEVSRRVPHLCNMSPSGPYALEDLDAVGGIPALMKELSSLLHLDAVTVTGKTVEKNIETPEI